MKRYAVKISKMTDILIEGQTIIDADSLKKARKQIKDSFPGYKITLIKEHIENKSDVYLK